MPNSTPSQNKQDNIKSLLDNLIQEQKLIESKNNAESIAEGNSDNTVGVSFMLYGLIELKKLIEQE